MNRKKIMNAGAAVNLALTLLYILAVVMMFRHVSFKLAEGSDHEMSISFLSPTLPRVLNWLLLCFSSLFVSIALFADGFSSRIVKFAAIATAVILAGCEMINFLSPIFRQISVAKKMAEDAAKFHWSAIYTLNLSVFIIRVFVALTSLLLAPWKGKNPKSSPSN